MALEDGRIYPGLGLGVQGLGFKGWGFGGLGV